MKISQVFILSALVFTLISCGDSNKEKEVVPVAEVSSEENITEEAPSDLDDGEVTANPEFENEKIAVVYGHYLDIKSALVNADPEQAKTEAQMMVDALQNVESGMEAKKAAGVIANSEDLTAQRIAFSELTAAVGDIFSNALLSGKIFKQYCPMAFEGEGGFWFSDSEEVRNPYFGDKMLKCGSVRTVIQ